jgi:ABC-type phosphate/phosphonate transport system substrate-binding protein
MALAVAWALAMPPGSSGADRAASTIRIGLAGSLFRETPASLVQVLGQPLKVLMEAQTGMTGKLEVAGDAESMARKLKEGKLQIAVMHGIELAWARKVNPDLKPLVLAVAHHRELHAHLIVRKDNPATCAADLKGKKLALPRLSREHCHLYRERRCADAELSRPMSPGEALDDVIDDVAQAAILDRAALDAYQDRCPDRLNELKVLHQSEPFPASAVVYQAGAFDDDTLRRFRDGLLGANRTQRGKELLKMCRITSFEEIPADYEQSLAAIVRAYPPKK